MDVLTKEQRKALKKVYDRVPLFGKTNRNYGLNWDDYEAFLETNTIDNLQSYRDFRRTVCYGYNCIMLPWCGMWLGIEKDGYTHS